MTISPQSKVTLHFSLALASGELVDSTFEKSPATLTMGDGSLLPEFEACLIGLEKGAESTFTLGPEKAFGQPNPQNVQRFKRHEFGADMVLEPGLVISFADAANTELPGVIKALEGDYVVVDFNHPLAGETLTFSVNIIDVSVDEESSRGN